MKAKYTDELLEQIVTEQNITLDKSYKNVKRDTKIGGQCSTENCPNIFCKPFRALVEKSGAYCTDCTKKNAKQQINEKQYAENLKKLLAYAQEKNIQLFDKDKYTNLNRDSRISGICTECNTQSFDKTFRNLFKSGALCDDCTEDKMIEKREEKCLEVYGVANVMISRQKEIRETHLHETGYHLGHTPEAEEKRKESLIETLKNPEVQNRIKQNREEFKKENGCDISHTPEAIEKRIATCNDRFGCDHPWQNAEVQEKTRLTNQDRYNCDNPAQNAQVQEKRRESCMIIYGEDHPMKNAQVRQKASDTYKSRTGFENPGKNPAVLELMKQTNLKLYGCEYPMQNAQVQEKASKNAYRAYDFICPSGDIRRFQGFEKFGMTLLLTIFPEDDIFNSRLEVPELYWKDLEGKFHRHFVDFFIALANLCVEIKSTWTFEKKREQCLLKQKYAKRFGFKYEIWVFDKKGNMVEKLV